MPISDETKRKMQGIKSAGVDAALTELLIKIEVEEGKDTPFPDALSLWNYSKARIAAMSAETLDNVWFEIEKRRAPRAIT